MIKKILIGILLICTQYAFATESIISSLLINDNDEREIEIVMEKDKMYLPCKYILDYLEIPYKESHAEKSLSFKNVVIKTNTFILNGKKENYPVYFIKNGMTGIQNEFFVSAEALSKATGKNVSSDTKQLIAFIRTIDPFLESEEQNKNPFAVKNGISKTKAYEEITLPEQKGWISIDTIGVRNNVLSDSYSQMYKDTQNNNCSMNNNLQVLLTGRLHSGQYKIDMGTNSYSNNMLAFSGMGIQYKNQVKDKDYIIGKADSWDFAGMGISTEMMGIQIKEHLENINTNYKNIEGTVSPTSIVKVYINNDFEKELSTYGGYYSLKDLYYGNEVTKIKIDEILADGTSKEIFYKDYKNVINQQKTPKDDFIMGINGLQNRLWANNGYIYQSTSKKFILGYKHKKEISEKLSFENFLIADKIISTTLNGNWNRSILGNKRYLNYTTMRNPNSLEGETYMGALTYKNNDKMDSKLFFGASNSLSQESTVPSGLGYFLKYENNYYANKDTSLKGSLFAGSPNFYMAGSSTGMGGTMADKIGASISGGTRYKLFSFSGGYSKYKSNFGNYYEGGLLDFDEYNLMARANFKKFPVLSLKINNKKGMNQIGEIKSSSCELSALKRIKCFTLNSGIRKNSYSNNYQAKGYSSYSSEYSDTFSEVSFPVGKKFGYTNLSHNIVETTSDTMINNYNSCNVSYSTPSFKGFNINLSGGFRYTGTTKGNDLGMGISKRLKSGSNISLNYRYSQTPYYIIDNMYLPSSTRHSITIDFSELYGIGSKGPEAIGTGNENKGYLQVSAFLDINQNGIKDKDEPMIDNIPIKVENSSEVLLTTKDGTTKLKAEDAGIHNVQIFEDELPTLLSCHKKTKPSRYIKINNNSKTTVDFGLISSVGNINGSVTIKDEFNNSLRLNDLVVSVLDLQGKEVNYTNLNEDGTFSFSGLSPGKYIISIDKELQDIYKLVPESNSENFIIEIPPEYKDYVNIDNVNLNYKYEL